MKTRIFTLLLAIAAGTTMAIAAAYTGTCGGDGDGSNLTWSLDTDDGVLAVSGTGTMAHYNASDHPWKPYTDAITSVVLDSGVTTIDDWAFCNSANVTSVSIPNTVTFIGEGAFNNCSSLISVTIPESVTSISYGGTFQYCAALQSVQWNAINCTIDPYAIDADDRHSYYPPFLDLNNLTSFTFGDNVRTIPTNLCSGIRSLTSVVIPESVTSISYGATFSGCTALRSVQWNAINCTLYPFKIVEDGYYYPPFHSLDNLTDFVFGDKVETIPDYLCCRITSLASVTIPESVTSIGYEAFRGCSSLVSVTIPENVAVCVTGGTFRECTSLVSVQWNAIDCALDKTQYGIYFAPFLDLGNINRFVFGEEVESVTDYLCVGLTGLASVALPDSVTHIGDSAFASCTGLTSMVFPSQVQSIGNYAFKDCTGFTFIVSQALVPPALGDSVFLHVDKSIPLYVPCEAVEAYKAAEQWKDFNIQECGAVAFSIPDMCADDGSLDIQMAFTGSTPVACSIMFDEKAVAQGFPPAYEGTMDASSSTADISIPLPTDPSDPGHYIRPDEYTFDITLTYDKGFSATIEEQPFAVLYPSWLILQRWNDLLALRNEDYNGGYTFSSIRWFHEGMPVEGRGEQGTYIYVTPNLAYGEAYWAELTRADDGVTMTTCPFYPVAMEDKTEAGEIIEPFVSVAPTALSPSNMTVTVQTNICGRYFVYNSEGTLLDRQPFCPPADAGTFTIDLSPYDIRPGMYMITFQGVEGTVVTAKIIVEP